jgi:hypothetical protein
MNHTLCHKANINKYKNIKIIPYILTDHNGIKLEINGKEKTTKNIQSTHFWTINESLKKVKKKNKKFLDSNENKSITSEPMEHSRGNLIREVCSYKCPHQKIREISNK